MSTTHARVLLAGLMAAASLPSIASDEKCSDVYAGVVQRMDYETSEASLVHLLYKNTCSSSNRSLSVGFDSSTQAMIGAIPAVGTIMGKLGASSSRSFCEAVDNNRFQFSSSEAIRIEPLEFAMANYNQCMKILNAFNVEVSHTIVNPGQVLVTVDVPNQGQTVEIQSVVVSGGFSCRRPRRSLIDLSADGLEAKGPFVLDRPDTITCVRGAAKTNRNEFVYPPGEIGIGTSVGRYVVKVPDDTVFGPESKQAAGSELRIREARITNLQQEVASLKGVMGNPRIEVKKFYFGDNDLWSDAHKGYQSRRYDCDYWHNRARMEVFWRDVKANFCPSADHHILSHDFSRNGEECGYNFFTMACVTYPEPASSGGRTLAR